MANDKIEILKSEFVERYAAEHSITKKQAAVDVDNFLTTAYRILAGGEGIKFNGFGKFDLKYRKPMTQVAQVGPRKGETVVIPEHYVLTFTPCDALRDAVKEVEVE